MRDQWEENYDGTCDICRRKVALSKIVPGVQRGWRVGYVCNKCLNSDLAYDPHVAVPPEIMQKAIEIDRWAQMNGHKDYVIGPIQKRK